jgi:transposase
VIGLPSLRALDGAPGPRIWLAPEATDMRCGFDRLAERVQAVIGADPLSGHLFLFRSRGGNRLKIPDVGPRRLRAVVQAAGSGRVQASSCCAWCWFG